MKPKICESHRKELLKFLLLKTAVVRAGIKPGELLRVRHCYTLRNAEGFQFCLYRRDIFEILKLDYLELRNESESSLALFYHPEAMANALAVAENRSVLEKCGYRIQESVPRLLATLKDRFSQVAIPHEVGVFIGYPAKDVTGFMNNLPRTPVHRGDWAVFGDAGESVERMKLYRQAESMAKDLLNACEDLQTFFERISNLNITDRSMANG